MDPLRFLAEYLPAAFGEYPLRHLSETPSNSTEAGEDSSPDLVSGGASEHHSHTIIILTYLFYAVSLATLVHFLIKRIPSCIRPPYAVTLFGLGAFLSYLHRVVPATNWSMFSESIGFMENINPEIVFFVILPPLLFESGMGLNWHVFRRLMWSAFILAFPGVLLNLFFIGLFAYISFGSGWTLSISFLLGSMLSTTDPVAVVQALHNLHAPDKLAILIDGESLLNDGSAIVGVLIFQNMVETGTFSILKIFDLLFRCAVGGCLFGIGFAGCQALFLRLVNKLDHAWPALETAVVVGGVYLCYLLSDLMHMSGIISVVSQAISMAVFGRGSFSAEAEHSIHAVVGQLAYFSNQLIWLIGGHMTAAQLSQSDVATDPVNWIRMVALYLMLNIARGISTWIMFPTLARMGYGLNLKETIMLIYSGLRGAICIALALMVRKSQNISNHILNEMGFYVAGSVMLTIVINGSTIETVYKYLKIYPKRTWSQIQMQRAVAQVEAKEAKFVESLKRHWFFKSANLQTVRAMLPDFARAEFNTETGELHVPMETVRSVMSGIMDKFDAGGGVADVELTAHLSSVNDDNGFLYSTLHVSEDSIVVDRRSSSHSSDETSLSEGLVDRLVRVVQLSDCRVKAVEPASSEFESAVRNLATMIGKPDSKEYLGLFQSARSVAEFATSAPTAPNPFATFDRLTSTPPETSAGPCMQFEVTLPDMGIHRSLLGTSPRLVVGLAPWNCEAVPGSIPGSCGIYTDLTKSILANSSIVSSGEESEFRREFVRGDKLTVLIETTEKEAKSSNLTVSFRCGRYFVGRCQLEGPLQHLHPTVAFLVPEEQAELSFALRTTTAEESRTESFAYILNAAICLYEDLFKSGALRAPALRTLNDSVQYGIDAANDDLEVKSMQKRVRTIRNIYTAERGKFEAADRLKYEAFADEGGPADRLSPLETEWGFLQLRHMKRADCNDLGFAGFWLRLGEFVGIRSQYRKTMRKMEEMLAYTVVHADLISHVEMARFPETLDLITRLVLTAKSYLATEVRRASPRDFYLAQHVLAAKILLNIRRKTLEQFAKEGSLSLHSVMELEETYFAKQLLALEDFTPSLPKNASILSVFTPPGAVGRIAQPMQVEMKQKDSQAPKFAIE